MKTGDEALLAALLRFNLMRTRLTTAHDNRAIQLASLHEQPAVVSLLLAGPHVAAASTAVDRAFFDAVHHEAAIRRPDPGRLPQAAPLF